MILYHYTSKASFDDILRTTKILPSKPWTTMDTSYGHGWYFTDLPPDKCDAWTVAYCWRSVSVFSKVECYLKFEIPDGILKHCRDHVYMINTWDNQIKYIEGKETTKCSKGPCIVCDVIGKVKQFFGLK
ncbi:HYD1 signature containing ADP-ribosyltransferase family protein [Verrucomicrobiota bacterium]